MPRCDSSVAASSKMRRLASWAIRVSRSSGASPDSPSSPNTPAASEDATSPARAPPMPSATA